MYSTRADFAGSIPDNHKAVELYKQWNKSCIMVALQQQQWQQQQIQ
jgi:hypothetical protein